MTWKWLANIVASVHGLWAILVVVGPIISWHIPIFRWVHLAMMILTLVLIFTGNFCPLTTLEQKLRSKHDPTTTYTGGFISKYLSRTLRFKVPESTVLIFLIIWVSVWGFFYWKWGEMI